MKWNIRLVADMTIEKLHNWSTATIFDSEDELLEYAYAQGFTNFTALPIFTRI